MTELSLPELLEVLQLIFVFSLGADLSLYPLQHLENGLPVAQHLAHVLRFGLLRGRLSAKGGELLRKPFILAPA